MATEILMPALSPTMTVGTLARWHKKEGDMISAGDVLAEIETDKATMDVEAVDEGILGRIFVEDGTENVAVNSVIAILVEEGEVVPDIQPVSGTASGSIVPVPAPQPTVVQASPSESAPVVEANHDIVEKGRIKVSPLARRLAWENGLELSSLTGTGPNGRIIRRDVEKGLQQGMAAGSSPASGGVVADRAPVEAVRHSSMRKVIARRLTESKTQVPHFYVSVDIELDALLALRSKLNTTLAEEGVKLSVNDMMIRAVALALRKQPGLNVQFSDNEMLHFADIDIAMAVSVPDGLITPVIRQADRKNLRQISLEARDLAIRARSSKLAPEEYQGGTFSISNMGMFGVRDFSAIINPPQSAILAIAAGEKRPVVRNNALEIATVMTATLSVDHRAVDGVLGAQWLNTFRDLVQNPYALVV